MSTFGSVVDSFLISSHAIALFLLSCCLFLHFHNHFYLHITCTDSSKSQNPLFLLQRRREQKYDPLHKKCLTCCGLLRSHEGRFNFYSILFTFYIILITFVSVLLCISNSQKQYYENRRSFGTYIIHHMFTSCIFGEYNALLAHDFATNTTEIVITCCVLSLTLMESFINYYRYFATVSGLKYTSVKILGTFKIFSVYCVIYLVLCGMQIFFIYWLFPIIILMHIGCNYYWISKFAKLMIGQFKNSPEGSYTLLYIAYIHCVHFQCIVNRILRNVFYPILYCLFSQNFLILFIVENIPSMHFLNFCYKDSLCMYKKANSSKLSFNAVHLKEMMTEVKQIFRHSLAGFIFSTLIIASFNMCPCMNLSFFFPIVWAISIMNYCMIFSRNRRWMQNKSIHVMNFFSQYMHVGTNGNDQYGGGDIIPMPLTLPNCRPKIEMLCSNSIIPRIEIPVLDIVCDENQVESPFADGIFNDLEEKIEINNVCIDSAGGKYIKKKIRVGGHHLIWQKPKLYMHKSDLPPTALKKIPINPIVSAPLAKIKKISYRPKFNKSCNSSPLATFKSKLVEEFSKISKTVSKINSMNFETEDFKLLTETEEKEEKMIGEYFDEETDSSANYELNIRIVKSAQAKRQGRKKIQSAISSVSERVHISESERMVYREFHSFNDRIPNSSKENKSTAGNYSVNSTNQLQKAGNKFIKN